MVALGGGTLESPRARELVTAQGGVVYLEVDEQQAWQRARDTGRPLAADEEQFRALLARRRAVYEEAADWILPVEHLSVEDLSREIVQLRAHSRRRMDDSVGPPAPGDPEGLACDRRRGSPVNAGVQRQGSSGGRSAALRHHRPQCRCCLG